MNQLGFPLLSFIVFVPLAGAVWVWFFDEENQAAIKGYALFVAGVDFLLSLVLYFSWANFEGMQFVDRFPWVSELGISFYLGVDGISLFFVLLTTLLTPLAILASWKSTTERVKGYLFFMLMLETGALGVFLSLDLVLFYVFWEAMLVPMYFLIGRWGGERRAYAAFKFFLYTMAGSALMLVAILALGYFNRTEMGEFTFDLLSLYKASVPAGFRPWLFAAFALAFAVKAPVVPFHTWLPDAYGEAPAPVTVMLAGVLSKMAIYGFLRFCVLLFPDLVSDFAPVVSALALVGIVYGSLVALGQKDVKQLVAYSSVAHLSLIVLGVFALNTQTLTGSIVQVVNHGVNIAALFLLVGMLYERRGSLLIEDFGGLWKAMPLFGVFLLIAIMASVGLPGLNGFVGEFTILVGVFRVNVTYAAVATLGIVLSAWYMLQMFRRIMEGPLDKPQNEKVKDLSAREVLILAPLLVFIFLIGVFPHLLIDRMDASVQTLLNQSQPTVVVEK